MVQVTGSRYGAGDMTRLSTLVNHAARRVLIALVVASVAVGGWLMSPRFEPVDRAGRRGRLTPSPGARRDADRDADSDAPTPSRPPRPTRIRRRPRPSRTVLVPEPAARASPRRTADARPGRGASAARARRRCSRAALDARLARLRAKYGIPGVSAAILFADGSIWRGTRRRRGRRDRRPGHARHLVLGRQRVEDVHGGADPRARRGRPAVARRRGQELPAVAADRPARSPSASCSTTPAACATSTSGPASTTPC